jgi:hypothetical protein
VHQEYFLEHNLPDKPVVDFYIEARAVRFRKQKKGPVADPSAMSFS